MVCLGDVARCSSAFYPWNWVWNYFTYDQSMRMIVYARKAKEIRDREKVEETTHWGKELVQEEKNPSITSSSK